jgi:threonine/homoserine/homoserine lactone efflux protein
MCEFVMNESLFIAYVTTAFIVMLVPGPDMLFCIATGMHGGRRAGFAASAGAVTGEIVHFTLAGFGLAAVFRSAPALYEVVRVAGACYLILLGVNALRHRDNGEIAARGARTAKASYGRGVVTNLLNPKMALFVLAFVPQFIDHNAGAVGMQFLVLGATFVTMDLLVLAGAGILAATFGSALRGSRAQTRIDTLVGGIYIGLGAKVALSD